MTKKAQKNKTCGLPSIFDFLHMINDNDMNGLMRLDEASQRAYNPYMLLRWLSGTQDWFQILMLNEALNPYTFNLQQHKPLLYDLAISSVDKGNKRYKYMKRAVGDNKRNNEAAILSVIARTYGCSTRIARTIMPLLTQDDIITMANNLGEEFKG